MPRKKLCECGICKICKGRAAAAKHRLAHPDAQKIANKKYSLAHPDRCRASEKKWRQSNPEAVKAQKKKWRKTEGGRAYAARRAKVYREKYGDLIAAKKKIFIKNNPVKTRAREKFHAAVRYGKIKRQPCEVCGKEKAHGHHDDYLKPLEVRWLCAVHHKEVHIKGG